MPSFENGKKDTGYRAAFVHGRPGPHPFHRALAEAVGADFYFVDFKMRWHDRQTSRPYRYVSMIVCGLFFPKYPQYKVIISEGLHSVPILARKLHLFSTRPKTAALMASETLYFLKTDFYSQRTRRFLLKTLSNYDALICVGAMQAGLAREVLRAVKKKPLIFQISGSSTTKERQEELAKVTPNLGSQNILFIANGSVGWRAWYKGIDVLLEAIVGASEQIPEITLQIVGEWSAGDVNQILNAHPKAKSYTQFVGKTSEIERYLRQSSLYVHIGRGDAFPVTVLESMFAGVPCIVSEWTGAKEAVNQVDEMLIVPVDAKKTAERIIWYLNLPTSEKQRLSTRSREVAQQYSESATLNEFKDIVDRLVVS